MADREDDDLQMAIRMSLQGSPPEAKRSKPRESEPAEELPEQRSRRLQREIMASAAEKRIREAENDCVSPARPVTVRGETVSRSVAPVGPAVVVGGAEAAGPAPEERAVRGEDRGSDAGEELLMSDAEQLFSMVFGSCASRDILAQWSNQGIRFSSDPETCMGLVQHEGGPCGVLAAIQAFVLKYLLFFPDDLGKFEANSPLQSLGVRKFWQRPYSATDEFASLTEDRKARALVHSMVEILFSCGSRKRVVVATLCVFGHYLEKGYEDGKKKEMIAKALEGLSIASASDLQKVLRVNTYTSQATAFHRLMAELPILESRMGAMLFLISALLSRGLESIQADRDDPSLPLVTAPFGHASQEIVNLLLCGQAVPNVLDVRMDLGDGMFLKGIPTSVEVGFLTLLESLNFCEVGQYLKCPRWPIWVVGSESHYTVLYALDPSVQQENELEEQASRIRKAFDGQDQSGGGGFISVEGFQKVLGDTNVNFPPEKLENLCCSGFIVWSELWQALLELDKSMGGLKDSSGSMGNKQFDVFHFNGIAKSVLNGNTGEIPVQRPRLCKLTVSVSPSWTQEVSSCDPGGSGKQGGAVEVNQPTQPSQHAPLVDCIKTRWPRAICTWVGDAPSIV